MEDAIRPHLFDDVGQGAAILQRELPKFSSTTEKSRFAEVTRQYVVERDARMTAMEAGTLFYSLQSDLGRESRVAMLPRPPRPKRPWTDNPPGPALFATARPNEWTGPAFGKILEAAPHGFSPDEMVYLQMIASAALWRDWDRVARASSMDAFGASVVLPLAKDMSFAEVPVVHFVKLKEVAYASASRAAYYMARKQLDSAEFVLKSTASFGFVMADNASNLLEQLIGIVIVGIGRDALIRFYAVTGNASGGHLKTARDSALAIRNARSEATDLVAAGGSAPTPSAPVARARMLAGAMRPGMQRSIRMQYLAFVGITPCTNLRELAFGPDPDVREAFDRARREIARFPSDSAQIDLMYESSARGYSGVERTASTRVGLALASFAGMLLHNPRVRGCAEMLFASSELF